MSRPNRLKSRLAAGDACVGCWLALGSAAVADVLAGAGFDAFIIDHEHGPHDITAALAQMRAAATAETTILMRVPSHDPTYLRQALDAGVEGLLIPNVVSAADAEAVVAACRYPPQGQRGVGHRVIRASDFGRDAAAYLASANARLAIICQIESAPAIDNVPALGAVDGIDALFIGPSDLSASIGKPGAFDDPEVQALIARAEARILETGTPLGGVLYGSESARSLFDKGYRFVAPVGDVALLRDGARAVLDVITAARRDAAP